MGAVKSSSISKELHDGLTDDFDVDISAALENAADCDGGDPDPSKSDLPGSGDTSWPSCFWYLHIDTHSKTDRTLGSDYGD